VLLLQSAGTLTQELFKHELALDERLDAMIDRAIKRLVHTKMMKQMMSQTSTEQADDQLSRVQNSKSNRLGKIVN
jgi:spore coat polysaccharide biosynthesis protein SpsF (cytidylyltransferase family)